MNGVVSAVLICLALASRARSRVSSCEGGWVSNKLLLNQLSVSRTVNMNTLRWSGEIPANRAADLLVNKDRGNRSRNTTLQAVVGIHVVGGSSV